MRRLTIILMCLIIFLTSCQTKIIPIGPWVQKIDSEEMSRIVINFSVKLKNEKRLDLEDSWVAYDDYIQKLCIRYSSQRLITLEEARLLIVEVVEELLYRINNNTFVSFELDHYPLTADDLDIKINFESFYGIYLDPLYIGLVWLQAGCVHFYAFDRQDNEIDWSHQRFEPYFKSRELALIRREAELPFTDQPRKSNLLPYDRYFTPAL